MLVSSRNITTENVNKEDQNCLFKGKKKKKKSFWNPYGWGSGLFSDLNFPFGFFDGENPKAPSDKRLGRDCYWFK